jgi:hypothetical protein
MLKDHRVLWVFQELPVLKDRKVIQVHQDHQDLLDF